MSERWSRRVFLAGLGTVSLAGCLSDADVPSTDPGQPSSSTSSPTPALTPSTKPRFRDSTATPQRSGSSESPAGTSASSTPTERPPEHGPHTTSGPAPDMPGRIDSEWPVPGADPGRTNYAADAAGPTGAVAELWRFISDVTFSQPVLADGTVYVGDSAGVVRALDARSSEEYWQRSVDASADTPWAVGGHLFVPTAEAIVALDPSDGTESWRVETPDRAAVLATDRGVYWLDANGPAVVALAPGDGSERWRTAIGDPWKPIVFAGETSIFVSSGTRDSRFWTLSADSGDVVGPEPRHGADFPEEQFYADGVVYAVDAFFGNVRATAVEDDASGWSQGVSHGGGGGGGLLSGGPDRVYYTSNADGEPGLHALSKTDGTVAWTADVNPTVTGRPVVAGDAVLLPTSEGIQCIDPEDGRELWTHPDVGRRVVVADDVLYAAGNGTVRALRPL